VHADLRSVQTFDAGVDDHRTWQSPDGPWSIYLDLTLGPAEDLGEEIFGLTVCNGEWLASRAAQDGIVSGRHHVIMATYDWPTVERYLEEQVRAAEGDTWTEVAERLARLAAWEFEDYEAS
jgi:hypothetical protein